MPTQLNYISFKKWEWFKCILLCSIEFETDEIIMNCINCNSNDAFKHYFHRFRNRLLPPYFSRVSALSLSPPFFTVTLTAFCFNTNNWSTQHDIVGNSRDWKIYFRFVRSWRWREKPTIAPYARIQIKLLYVLFVSTTSICVLLYCFISQFLF